VANSCGGVRLAANQEETMRIDFSCPISGARRDNTTVRIVAGLTVLITAAAVALAWLSSTWIAALVMGALALDFALRAFGPPKYSPLAALARGIGSAVGAPQRLVDAAPKIFAARIGLVFAAVTAIWLPFNLMAATVVAAVLVVCAFLESAFGFCLGCQVYSLLPPRYAGIAARDFRASSTGSLTR
jgi:hypothetical protein